MKQLFTELRIFGGTLQSRSCSNSDPTRLCYSLSRQWAPFKNQSHKELFVEHCSDPNLSSYSFLHSISTFPAIQDAQTFVFERHLSVRAGKVCLAPAAAHSPVPADGHCQRPFTSSPIKID